ncbi:hypothetical protein VKQ53_27140 [Escherichia coli]|uniref:hypothetical protein n=1 Tax=Escherichia coli TaxID=562 RepID=UPI00388D3C9D
MLEVIANFVMNLFMGFSVFCIIGGILFIASVYIRDYREPIEKTIDDLHKFNESIRYLPRSEQKKLTDTEIGRRQKERKITSVILLAGAIAFIPALVWSGICLYNNAVLENFRSLIGLFMLSPAVMLATEFTLKKILR